MADGASSANASSSRPSAHAQRYDRQLRLWASSGQASLESAHVVVLGASYLGACVLKNIVLPGMGAFTLIDGRLVDQADLGNNFFIDQDALGKGRAQEVTRNLIELNPQVKGVAVEQDPMAWLKVTASLDRYTLIVAINQPLSVLVPLADQAWHAKAGVGVPLMSVNGTGLVGSISVQLKEAGIIESHPDSTIDLRLTRPWPALDTYAKQYDMDTADTHARSHVPYSVLLLRKLKNWADANDGRLPQPSEDRKAFIQSVESFRGPKQADDENIDEAIAALGQHVWRPIASREGMPANIAAMLDDEAATRVTDKSTNFWLLVRALREFVRSSEGSDGTLPLAGSLPDMKALSATYVELQRIYRAKALEDVSRLRECLDTVLRQVGLPVQAISQGELESFAKHAEYLKLIRGRPIRDILDKPSTKAVSEAFADPVNPVTIPYHFAILAAEDFYERNQQRYPGASTALSANVTGNKDATENAVVATAAGAGQMPPFEEDFRKLFALANARLASTGLVRLDETQKTLVEEACKEVTRAGHADLPSTAALLGGVAAQEAIKLVTRQYTPLDNAAVYDGIKQAIGVFRL